MCTLIVFRTCNLCRYKWLSSSTCFIFILRKHWFLWGKTFLLPAVFTRMSEHRVRSRAAGEDLMTYIKGAEQPSGITVYQHWACLWLDLSNLWGSRCPLLDQLCSLYLLVVVSILQAPMNQQWHYLLKVSFNDSDTETWQHRMSYSNMPLSLL